MAILLFYVEAAIARAAKYPLSGPEVKANRN
jgi:hypothetical protein